jgi:hypothetical protein
MHVTLDELVVEERLGVLAEFHCAIVADERPETDVRDNISSLQLVLGTAESAMNDGKTVALQSTAELLVGGYSEMRAGT